MLRFNRRFLALTGLGLLTACPGVSQREVEAQEAARAKAYKAEAEKKAAETGEPRKYPPVDPDAIVPLDVFHPGPPVGPGYEKVPVKIGKTLHRGKWLGLSNGDARFFGPDHVMVNHFRRRPDYLGEGDLIKTVVVNVHTGEEKAEFYSGRYVDEHHGLAIVFKHDDERPYLLHAESGEMVPALPEGKHAYDYTENYYLRFSHIAKRVWIHATDAEGKHHLYEWEDLHAPPELPNNPIPFPVHRIEPSHYAPEADVEIARPQSPARYDCERILLHPPKGFECIEDDREPMAGGWWWSNQIRSVFNVKTGEGYDLSSLCPEDKPVVGGVANESPPRLELMCKGDHSSVDVVWTPPNHVARISPEDKTLVIEDGILAWYKDEIEKYEIYRSDHRRSNTQTHLNRETHQYELIGSDYRCPEIRYRSGKNFAIRCAPDGGYPLWFDLVDPSAKKRGRIKAVEIVASWDGTVVGIIRTKESNKLVQLSL